MATFVIRVQIAGSSSNEDYQALNTAMARSHYRQTIEGSRVVWLPDSQYIKLSNSLTADLIRDEVKKIVRQVYPGNQFQLMVVEMKTWASYGLVAVE